MGTWQDYQLETAPPWLQTGTGEAWVRGLGDEKDELESCTKDAVKARFPSLSPVDGLYRAAGERGLSRGAGELLPDFRSRVATAWDAWIWAGTAKGVLQAIRDAGYVCDLWILSGTGRYHRLSAAGVYSWGQYSAGAAEAVGVMPSGLWSGFRLLFNSLPAQWQTGIPFPQSDEVENLRRIVKQWKSSYALFEGFAVRAPVVDATPIGKAGAPSVGATVQAPNGATGLCIGAFRFAMLAGTFSPDPALSPYAPFGATITPVRVSDAPIWGGPAAGGSSIMTWGGFIWGGDSAARAAVSRPVIVQWEGE